MRTQYGVIAVSLAAALTACSRQDAPTAAATSHAQPATDLAAAPRPYQRMRFVSAIEQSKGTVLAPSIEHVRHASPKRHDDLTATRSALTTLMSAPATVAVATASALAPSVVVASPQAAPPIVMPVAAVSQAVADGGRGSGLVGNVVIRGGLGPNGKCDPRSDAQAAGMLAGRPNSSMPVMPSSPVFGRR